MQTDDEARRNGSNPRWLATRFEIAEYLGLTKQGALHVSQRIDFPLPVSVCRDGREPIWWASSIWRWANDCGRDWHGPSYEALTKSFSTEGLGGVPGTTA